MSRFRLNATHLLLTYPQCPVEKQEAFDFLMERLHPELLLVAREVHADGNYHLHAYCKLNPKGNFTDPHFADLRIGDQRYHGNYELPFCGEGTEICRQRWRLCLQFQSKWPDQQNKKTVGSRRDYSQKETTSRGR